MELVGDEEIHSYHCDCRNCDFQRSDFPLRVQRDSSCDGEIISSPFTSSAEAREVQRSLAAAAVEVDAEPGYAAGFHVHVDMGGTDMLHRARVLWGFMRWEPFIERIAAGRYPQVRTAIMSSNRRVRNELSNYCYNPASELERQPDDARNDFLLGAFEWYRHRDRHSHLNVRTRYNTFEFRIWNSTRSAWRMDLFTRLSVALCNPNVAEVLTNTPMPVRGQFGQLDVPSATTEFLAALRAGRQGAVADLLNRQLSYLDTTGGSEAEFTAA